MTVLRELTLGFVVEILLHAAFWTALAGAAAITVHRIVRGWPRRPSEITAPFVAALIGTIVAGSLSHRFDAPALLLTIGRREIPVLWSLGGAVAGAFVWAVSIRRRIA
jgi:hypothetical protein